MQLLTLSELNNISGGYESHHMSFDFHLPDSQVLDFSKLYALLSSGKINEYEFFQSLADMTSDQRGNSVNDIQIFAIDLDTYRRP
jgi:hypothetical protein